MPINIKIALSAALILTVASAALANDLDPGASGISARKWSEHPGHGQKKAPASSGYVGSQLVPGSTVWREWGAAGQAAPNASSCPWLEGYPDCHPE
jgi:hypothetical protein